MAGAINPQSFSASLVILGAAGLVIPGFARFRISPVIGFILVGLAVGPSGLGALVAEYPWLYHVTISNREAIEPFAELGVILLPFSIGLELRRDRAWPCARAFLDCRGAADGRYTKCGRARGLCDAPL